MRKLVIVLTLCAAASGQSMLESGAVIAGTTVGSAAGKKVSDGINASLKRTGGVLEKAAKTSPAPPRANPTALKTAPVKTAPATPLLQVSAGVPKAELNNVPPPPPRRPVARKPAKPRPVELPAVMSAVRPEDRLAMQVNVDISGIHNGMARDSVLALGIPSARITMYLDGHVMEIYQYRNATAASGTVRLRDGEVWAVEARP